jgi:hypothetical protein
LHAALQKTTVGTLYSIRHQAQAGRAGAARKRGKRKGIVKISAFETLNAMGYKQPKAGLLKESAK